MYFTTLSALNQSPNGQMRKSDVLEQIEQNIPLDDWATTVYASGNTRWKSIFHLSSIGLVKGGYVVKFKGTWTITDEGRAVLNKPYDPAQFLDEVKRRYDIWKNSQIVQTTNEPAESFNEDNTILEIEEEPREVMARALKKTHETLSAELIESIKQCDPAFFERLVIQLLLKMGYGGSRQEAGRAVGQSGDNGIDGIINEDRLGLDAIYLQAKRWENSVGEPPIRDFFGALDIKGVKKGVFITTSYFTPAALKVIESNRSDKKIVLIDGARLAELMIEHDLGVSVEDTFTLKRLDSDFFSDD
ncbi:restriction endonuclease [Formosimonas limnophila]|nr:restriction endonuclease [Formosimonas limnophila]